MSAAGSSGTGFARYAFSGTRYSPTILGMDVQWHLRLSALQFVQFDIELSLKTSAQLFRNVQESCSSSRTDISTHAPANDASPSGVKEEPQTFPTKNVIIHAISFAYLR